MAADGEGGDEPSSSFRWIDAARYVLASVVTILMVVVVVKAKLVLRPKLLYLSVPGGSVFVSRSSSASEDPLLVLDFTIRSQNPSGRALLYYINITGYIFDENMSESSLHPQYDSIAFFDLDDMILPQRAEQFSSKTVKLKRGKAVEPSYFEVLYEGEGRKIFSDMTLRLDGTLIIQPKSNFNITSRTTFYCRPLLIGGNRDVGAYVNKQEAFCVSS